MASIQKGNEEMTALVLANVCIAFVVLGLCSPETSRPYLYMMATALGLFALIPVFQILQRPRRFMVGKETEGDKSVFVIKYKGYLWWYNAKDRKGNVIVFKTMDEAQKFIKEDIVTVLINDKMRRKTTKREFEVILDSKKMAENTDFNTHKQTQNQTPKEDSSTTSDNNTDEKEEINPDNDAVIANMVAMAQKEQYNEEKEVSAGENKNEKKQKPGIDLHKQENSTASDTAVPSKENPVTNENKNEEYEDGDIDDPFDSRYKVPDDEDDENVNPEEQTETGPEEISGGQKEEMDGESLNEAIFDVIDNFNKYANQKKTSPPKKKAQSQQNKVDDGMTPQKDTMVTTAQVFEGQTLVHAHRAETITDALSKILYHQQIVEQKEEDKMTETKEIHTMPPSSNHQNVQAIPKSKRNKRPTGNKIPTKNIKYKPTSDEAILKKRQMTLHEMPGFDDDELIDDENPETAAMPEERQTETKTAPRDSNSDGDATETNDSSGGPKIVKKLDSSEEKPEPTATLIEVDTEVVDNTITNDNSEVFSNGSENQDEEPLDEDKQIPIQQ